MIAIKKSLIWRLAVGYWQLAVSCWVLAILPACSSRALHEAQEVVTQADSLWHKGQMYGRDYGDSATLAAACHTLSKRQFFYPDDYTHCCYHYGRLLREKDNPLAAIECFINATQSRTHDYHILGRVYSNMGDLCHLAGDFCQSYDMYKHSTELFLHNGDTLNYYYGLYRMAFEKALLADTISCATLLNIIENSNVKNDSLTAFCNLVRAEASVVTKQYDSAIHYAHKVISYIPKECTGNLLLSQAYSYSGVRDSAVYYAQLLLEYSNDFSEQNNALYILTNDDSSNDTETLRKLASQRADIQKLLELRRGEMTKASQLLEQHLNRKPNLTWIFAITATLIIIAVILYFYKKRQKREHALLSQKVEDLTQEYTDLQSNKINQLKKTCELLSASKDLSKDLCWKDFDKMCNIIDENFYFLASKLKQMDILNEQEIKLCVLVLLNIKHTEIADILSYAPNGVGKLKYRVAQKLGTKSKNLQKYLISLAVSDSNFRH